MARPGQGGGMTLILTVAHLTLSATVSSAGAPLPAPAQHCPALDTRYH